MRHLRWLFAILALLFSPLTAVAQQPVKIRVAWIAPVSNWASLLLEKKDLARHLGKSYVLEPTRYVGTPQMITALANNELEVASLAFSTLPVAILNAGLTDLRVIADELQDGVPGHYSQEYMVLTDGPIKKVEDLKGKVVGTVAPGAAVDVAIRMMLKKHGLEDKRDYVMLEAPLPTMRAMLSEKKVGTRPVRAALRVRSRAATGRDPAVRQPRRRGRDAAPVPGGAPVLHRQEPRGDGRVHGGHAADTAWYKDPANHKEMAEIAGRITKQPPERFGWAFTEKDYYRAPGMRPNLEALQKNVGMIKDLGFVKDDIDVAKHPI